jgi:hypothetical protein
MDTLIMLIMPIIAALAAWLVATILRKAGLSPEATVRAVELVRAGVMRAEAAAAGMASKVRGPDKMAAALAFIDRQAQDHPDLAPYLRSHAQALAERILRSTLTPDSVTPHSQVQA